MTAKSPIPDNLRAHASQRPASRAQWGDAWFSAILLLLIRVYQLMISPFFGPSCRFEPSCSRYAASCIRHLGPARGAWLTLRRLARCHPLCAGGYDPPPSNKTESSFSGSRTDSSQGDLA